MGIRPRWRPTPPPPSAPPAKKPTSSLAALLKEFGIEDGRLPGVYEDAADGHGTCPWRSNIRRAGFDHVLGGRPPACAAGRLVRSAALSPSKCRRPTEARRRGYAYSLIFSAASAAAAASATACPTPHGPEMN